MTATKKILITGATGNLGQSLIPILLEKCYVLGLIIRNKSKANKFRDKFPVSCYVGDLIDEVFVSKVVSDFVPDIVIHMAAITNAQVCENNKKLAWDINVQSTKRLLDISVKENKNVYFIYISSAGVFDCKVGGYDEESLPNPQNYYCLTKYEAEKLIKIDPHVCIIRTNFIQRKKWPYEKAFTDRFGTYLFSTGVAKGLIDVIIGKPIGIIHLVGDKKISMFELARITTPNIKPMTTKEFQGFDLPKNMELISKKWKIYSLKD